MQINYRVSIKFSSLTDLMLDGLAVKTKIAMTGNPLFPDPPVSMEDLGLQQAAFHSSIVAASGGGVLLTALKNEKRVIVEGSLRKNAAYVQSVAGQNLAGMLSSGFDVASTNRTPSPLSTPFIRSLELAPDSKVLARVAPVRRARSYQFQKQNGGEPVLAGIFGSTRNMLLVGFVSGNSYDIQVRAVGGTLGYSEWSQPVSILIP